jgi:sugar/nucleoside kinase (ribokinase family)
MPRVVVCAIGDLLLDVVVRPAATPRAGADVSASTRVSVGGQAANVAAWTAHLGATARLVCKRGDDAAGRLAAAELVERGVAVLGPVAEGLTGTVVAMLDDHGDRTMMSDRGVSPTLDPGELDPDWFVGIDRLHVTGYGLVREPMLNAVVAASEWAQGGGARISLDLSAWPLIADVGALEFRRRVGLIRPELIFGTAAEFDAMGGVPAVAVAVVKDGARGVHVHLHGQERAYPAPDVTVVDATGAGDAFAAGFLLGPSLDEAVALATEAAGRCLTQIGAMP